ncbi:MAG: molybdopterin-binding protein [Chloroflexi bacterium]|nr:molybdopterin-binding protein [Chloroflexota bacterium]MCI0577075.1 molybdopterin-binding protein [Chloroflexota bacterium]MCI0650159.1 molybdopterin-binding protein [Chloroflexota bacterium]MCI0728014.1 molybdopterin-binding protein [Chloroflexota bacterium]
MNVVLISIGTELLFGDILDTNAAQATRRLREMGIPLIGHVTIGDDRRVIAETLRGVLEQVTFVITIGGLGRSPDDLTRLAVADVTGRYPEDQRPEKSPGVVVLGDLDEPNPGYLLELAYSTLICLPGKPRDMAYLLETEVLPYLQDRFNPDRVHGRILLRTAGVMESTLEQQLADLNQGVQQRVSFSSYAGQTDIGLWVEGRTQREVDEKLQRLAQEVSERLGDQIYGREGERLEKVLLRQLHYSGVCLAVAECHTGHSLAQALQHVPGIEAAIIFVTGATEDELADTLGLDRLTSESDLTRWCRMAAEQVVKQSRADVGLVVYNHFTPGGVQILVTLASAQGVSMIQRSFGGHPTNINQWASTLGLIHVRRWLLAHHPTLES